jgi:hypothetical protein
MWILNNSNKLNVFMLHVYLLDYPVTWVRHCNFTEREDNASKYMS